MSLFNRHKHTWELKAVQEFSTRRRFIWEDEWRDGPDVSILRYVCSTCQADRSRQVTGTFTFEQAEEVFPRP